MRRRQVFYLSRPELERLLRGEVRPTSLPSDARVDAAMWDLQRDALGIAVVSDSFDMERDGSFAPVDVLEFEERVTEA